MASPSTPAPIMTAPVASASTATEATAAPAIGADTAAEFTTVVEQVTTPLDKLCDKYSDLMWYARKGGIDHPMWKSTPQHIRDEAFKQMAIVEAKYPVDVAALKGDSGDWQHGFNSGCVAAFRLALGLIGTMKLKGKHDPEVGCEDDECDDDDGDYHDDDGPSIDDLVNEFPMLDS